MSLPAVKKERNSAVELLRIIAMYMIVVYHCTLQSGFDLESASFGLQKFTYEILQTGAIGVDIFVLITGFFGYKSGSNPKKIISLLLEVEFYSILVGVCMILTGDEELSASYVLHTLFPTTFKQYWFFTAHIVLMLLSPYINKFIAAVSRADHLKLIAVMIVLWGVIPFFTDQDFYFNEVITVIMLYIIGAYLGKYSDNVLAKGRNAEILTVICSVLLAGGVLACGIAGKYVPAVKNLSPHFYVRLSPLVIGLAAGLLATFTKMNFRSGFINKVASCTFAVYLIHYNPYFCSVLWKKYLKSVDYVYTKYWFLYLLISTVVVFAACIIIEFIRKSTIEKPLNNLAGKIYDKAEKFVIKIIDSIKKKIHA